MSARERRQWKQGVKWAQALVGFVLFALVVSLALYINSDRFQERVRLRVVAELERMTGRPVELEALSWNISELRIEARGLTIHGLEGEGEPPFVHANHILLRLKILSFLERKVALREVVTDGLTVHLMVGPNGVTNQPGQGGEGLSTESLIDLAVSRVEVHGGTLIINQQRIPLDLAGEQLSVGMTYSHREHGYEGNVAFSVVSARWGDMASVSGQVDLRFLLRATEAEIKSLKLRSGHSNFEAAGTLRNFDHPEIQLKYTASLDLAEAARLAKVPQLRGGRADVKGELGLKDAVYSSQGNFAIHGLEARGSELHVSRLDAESPFVLTPEKIVLSHLTARAFNGNLEGDAQVTNWSAPAGQKSRPQQGTINLRLSSLQVNELATALSTSGMPLEKIGAQGSASGVVKASWTGSPERAVAAIDVDIEPPSSLNPQQVPVSAQLHATYHGDIQTLDVGSLHLATRAIRLQGSGELGSRTAQARLSVSATDLREVQPVLEALSPGTHIPVSVGGRASFNGVLFGELDALSVRGHVELEDFVADVSLAESHEGPAAKTPRVHWDSLVGDLAYSPSSVTFQRGVLRRGKGQFGFSVTAGLNRGKFDENHSQIILNLRMDNEPAEDFQTLAGLNYPVTGILTAELHANGSMSNLHGVGKMQIARLTAYGEPFQSFSSQIRLEGKDAELNNLLLVHNSSRLSGSAAYNFSTQGFRFDLTGSNIDLATLRSLQAPKLAMAGKAGFHVTGSMAGDGTGTPVINGRLDVASLALNREVLGNINVTLETRGEQLVVRGRSSFEDATVNLDGSLQLRGDFPGQWKLQFAHVDFDPLLRAYLEGQITGHSSIEGSVDIRGPMRRPRDLNINGNVTQLSANLETIKLENEGPIHFYMDREVIRADQFHLVGQDTDLYIRGGVGVAGAHALDLHTKGRLNLKLAQEFNKNIVAQGPVTFTVDVAGNISQPQMNGRLQLDNASVSLADLPNGLSHIQGSMVFAQDRVQIEKLTAQSGGGELNVGGFLAYRHGLYFDLTATGKDVRLRAIPGFTESADANLRYTGSSGNSALTGDITITRLGMRKQFDFDVFLAQSTQATTLTTVNPFLDNLRLDVHIVSTPDLQVETSVARASGSVDLHVRGTAARPAVLGRINIAEGDVVFNGTKYRLERGDVTFNNPLLIEPVINIEMSARVQNYNLTVGLHGTLSGGRGLTLTYRSDPPLSNDDIIALLAFGRTQNQDLNAAAQPGQNTTATGVNAASNAVLGEALNAAVGSRVERLFGGSRVRFDPQFLGQTGNSPSTRVTVEQQVSNNVTFTYGTSLTQSTETVIQVEYNIDKNLSIVAVRDQNGVLSFDVTLRRRRK
ncbi:MAG TPA: translocation/assembly module TamB domain-containing protein [Candidatus Angelobacter sp.]|nr:translocation/assembly module TamB domain-containing protein [Candidatus Angelobacter sp.]